VGPFSQVERLMSNKTKPNKLKERLKKCDDIAKKIHDKRIKSGQYLGVPGDCFHDNIGKIYLLERDRNKAIESLEEGTNDVEREERKLNFLKIHKELQVAFGPRPCKARDCTKTVPPGRTKYCSDGCGDRQKARDNRARDPKGHQRAKLKQLLDLKKEGDLD
jgi:hypothetical protein